MKAREANFDGLVGPTHHYGGLSHGNVASMAQQGAVSRPREAALQGLGKMRFLVERGYWQGVLPPQERPDVRALRSWGFTGRTDADILARVAREAPGLLEAASSSSAMWTANAATVSPSADTADGRVHFSVANLGSKLHRAIEPEQTERTLRAVFREEAHFVVHPALPGGQAMADEGAANHTRLAADYGEPGLEWFVFGREGRREDGPGPKVYPARQTLEASQAVARRHGLQAERVRFSRQAGGAIDAGVFHHDVIAVGNLDGLLLHEAACAGGAGEVEALERQFLGVAGRRLRVILAREEEAPLDLAVKSYLFNSQLLDRGDGTMLLLAPVECQELAPIRRFLDRLTADPAGWIREAVYSDLRQSMRNGGGPACLRLRVVLTEEQKTAVQPGVWIDGERLGMLEAWVKRHFRETLRGEDLADPALLEESRRALEELTRLLGLGAIYPFQGAG